MRLPDYPARSLVCLCGVPGAGKTYLAEQLAERFSVVSVDACRVEVARTGNPQDKVVTKLAFGMAYDQARAHLRRGRSVLFDSTALSVQSRRSLTRFARGCRARAFLLVVDVPRDVAETRNADRQPPWRVPDERFDDMWNDYEQLRRHRVPGFAAVRTVPGA